LIQAFNKKLSIIEAQRLTDSINGIRKTTTFFKTTDNLKRRPRKQLLALHEKTRFAEKKIQIDSMRLTAKGYPVNGFLMTLFHVYSKLGSFSAKRADAISVRITNLADNMV
jgi:hypothetical protein